MSKDITVKDKLKKKDIDALDALLPVLQDYMATIMPAYLDASSTGKLFLRAHNPTLDKILSLTEV